MEALVVGLAAAFNLLVIKWKLEAGRTSDAVLDITFFSILTYMFSGSMGGMIIATIASATTSLMLYFNPPTFHKTLFQDD